MMCSPRLPAPAPMRPDRCRGGGGDPAGCGAVDLDGIPDVHDGVHHDGPHLHARGTLYPNPPTHTSQNATPYLPRLIVSLAPASAACLGSAGQHTHTHHTHRAHAPPACCTRRRSAPPLTALGGPVHKASMSTMMTDVGAAMAVQQRLVPLVNELAVNASRPTIAECDPIAVRPETFFLKSRLSVLTLIHA